MTEPGHLWEPAADALASTRMGRYMDWLASGRGVDANTYDQLWRWSVTDVEGFWSSVWEYFEATPEAPPGPVLADPDGPMADARWFPEASLSYPARVLAGRPNGGALAVVARSQTRPDLDLTWDDLADQVARARAGLSRLGVGPGDRVVAYLPNIPETVVAFLAAASLGAVWSSCAPEFGVRSVLDRFTQIEPKVLIAVDGYRYGAKAIDRRAHLDELTASLPSLTARVILPYLDADLAAPPGWMPWSELVAEPAPLEHEMVPFDHPLYILYSSGTTGLPKPIVHGHGGILLEHLKSLALHHDLGPGDRFFWFSTTGWMMWNYLVSGLAVGATLVLFDGDPGHPDLSTLWRLAEEAGVTFFGTSAPFVQACTAAGVEPRSTFDLSALRAIGSTGAPLSPDGFRWLAEHVAPDAPVWSISGGTDVCTAFVTGSPLVPVWEGEISCRGLGCAVAAFDPSGRPVVGEVGELVLTEPMPSMPVAFWADPDGARRAAAYFDDLPGVWRHGDWVTITDRGSVVISGRSDATLNRGGVRLGTAELYSVVERDPDVADSLVVHLDDPAGGAGELVLFVVTRSGGPVSDEMKARLAGALRAELSPRHVPDRVVAVPAVPRTLSGKKLEVPVKRILAGADPATAVNPGVLADPTAIDPFIALANEGS